MFSPAREEIIRERVSDFQTASPAKPALTAVRPVSHVALVASFPPRRCGIATFTADVYAQLVGAAGLRCDVVSISDGLEDEHHEAVRHVIAQDNLDDYARVARQLNADGVELVCVQHEFGIFGGDAGDFLLTFLDALECPVVITLHTVLEQPNPDQSRVMAALQRRAARLIVMAERGRRILVERYNVPPDKVAVIPHGAPDQDLIDPDSVKPRFALDGREVMLTFGLLSPNKGIESVIRALPDVIKARPNAMYVVLGATHPHLVRREGEAYRECLIKLAEELGVSDHIRFVNSYVGAEELLAYLSAADLYITPYLNEAQITSGTLSYAVALGKPVISTPYWHARELLAGDVGVLVDFNDSAGFSAAMVELLRDHAKREAYRARAYAKGRETIWSRAGSRYLEVFAAATQRAPRSRRATVEAPNFAAVERLSDQCGMLQHGLFSLPDRNHGYCTDDNARALILMMRARGAGLRGAECDRLITSYAAFIAHAWNDDRGRFRNFMSYDRRWLEEEGSLDSFGRALWSLGETACLARDPDLRDWAIGLASRATPHVRELTPIRSLGFSCLGLSNLLAATSDVGTHAALMQAVEPLRQALAAERKSGWIWFEPKLSYDNARLPEAMLRAGAALDDAGLIADGLEALKWLAGMQTAPEGYFRPVGNESFGLRYATPTLYEQQPIEAAAMIDACWAAFDASGDTFWEEEAHRAYGWFFGRNALGASLAAANGGCYDGLQRGGVNRNQGAESVLSLQLSHCAMKARERTRKTAVC